ncbi:MAG TPA: hypothetical protein VGB54_03460 [Allosphingosinicella sp.]|jgi:hypothetical protein
MKLVIAMAAAGALLISGCNSSDRNRDRDRDRTEERDRDRDRDKDTARNDERERDPAPAADRGGSQEITESWFAGRWADSRDCTRDPVVFRPDGTFVAANGGTGRWSVTGGDTLVLEAGGRSQEMQLRRVSDDEVGVVGTGGASYRCD